jgi:hypothetical protein
MRLPVDSCSIALLRLRLFTDKAFCAMMDFTLVLITDMVLLLQEIFHKGWQGPKGSRTCLLSQKNCFEFLLGYESVRLERT